MPANGDRTPPAIAGLAASIARLTEHDEQPAGPVPGLALFRRSHPSTPHSGLYQPSLCIVAQGAKEAHLGQERFVYDVEHYLITSVQLPAMFRVSRATPAKPYLGLTLIFDLVEVARLMADSQLPPPRIGQPLRGMATARADAALIGAVQRLVDLLDHPQDIPVLAPLIRREIIYRLLIGDEGARLRQMVTAGSQSQHLSNAISWLNRNFTAALRIDRLALMASMSPSTFHHHFRNLTALSPLQYQKQLRLREARRLMLAEDRDAASAAFSVGYESPSQFSREYRRLFGDPPARDIAKLRQAT